MAPAPQAYENSSSYLEGIIAGLKEAEAWPRAEGLSAEQLEMLEQPRKLRWWRGALLAEVIAAVEAQHGAAAVERAAYLAIWRSVAPVAMPLIKVSFAVFGATPEAIFSRASSFSATAVRGVEIAWEPQGKEAGRLAVQYPVPVAAAYPSLWRGTLRYVFELTQVAGEVGEISVEEGKRLVLPVRWEKKK